MSGRKQSYFDEFEASELFCSSCGQAQPVRKHLLLVLAQGNKFDYRCSVCGNSVGSKMDDDTSSFSVLAPK